MYVFQKGKKEKNEEKKGHYYLFKSLGSHFYQRGKDLQQREPRCNNNGYSPFCLHLCGQK